MVNVKEVGAQQVFKSLGRKWIGIDNSGFAITTIKNRLMGTDFKYYDLKDGYECLVDFELIK